MLGRRMLMAGAGIAGAAALARVAHAGPLNPPSGAIASTGRTTTESYEAARKGWIEINSTNTPPASGAAANITQPGYYYLAANLECGNQSAAIRVASAGVVVIDLNGFCINLQNSADGKTGVAIDGPANATRIIRNGVIHVRQSGVGASFYSNGGLIEDITVVCRGGDCIGLDLSSNPGLVVRRCNLVNDTASNLTFLRGVSAQGGVIEDCVVTGSQRFGVGIDVGTAMVVRRCVVRGSNGVGIGCGAHSRVVDCEVIDCGGNGIQVGSDSSVERCQATVITATVGTNAGISAGANSVVQQNVVNGFSGGSQVGIRVGSNSLIMDNRFMRCTIAADLNNQSACLAARNILLACPTSFTVNNSLNVCPTAALYGVPNVVNPLINIW